MAAANARTWASAFETRSSARSGLSTAAGDAKAVGVSAAVESPDLTDDLVSKADAQVRALAAAIDDEEALPEELRDVEAPAAGTEAEPEPEADADDNDESSDEEPAEADDAGDADDEDGGDGGDALGDMFG